MFYRKTGWALLVALTLATGLLPLPGFAAPSPLPLAELIARPRYSQLQLSPDGKHLAALAPVNGRINLVVIELATMKSTALTDLQIVDVGSFAWVNDQRLVFETRDNQAGSGGGEQFFGGSGAIHAIDVEGGHPRELIASPIKQIRAGGSYVAEYGRIVRVLNDGSDDIILSITKSGQRSLEQLGLFRVNTRNAHRESISFRMPPNVVRNVLDAHNVIRAVQTRNTAGTADALWYRQSADSDWIKLEEFATEGPDTVTPIAFDADNKTLLVLSRRGRDTEALFTYDTAARKLGEQLVAHPRADITPGDLRFDRQTHELLSVSVDAGRTETAYFAEGLAQIAKTVDQALPGRENHLSGNVKGNVLVTSHSDSSGNTYYLYDTQQKKLTELVRSHPWLNERKMAQTEFLSYQARDGLSIPAYLTLPPGTQPGGRLPLVVLVHGGPWVRDHWGFNTEVQLLASRGYAVLQPQYRGSTGFGYRHYTASFGQWGLSMQDDLDDGVDFLVKQGRVDPDRVAIMGASYGGFAVLSALSRTPDRYRCGIDIVGVSDPSLMFKITWSDFAGEAWIKNNAKVMIGDLDKDAVKFAKISPIAHARDVKAPVLMAYGIDDRRVPLPHGEKMRDALLAHGGKVDWMTFEGEGHGFQKSGSRLRLYAAIEKFLSENMAPL